jgi:hypothetical protein
MTSVASQLIEEVTAHAQSDSLEDAQEICPDGTYFLNNLRTFVFSPTKINSTTIVRLVFHEHWAQTVMERIVTHNFQYL